MSYWISLDCEFSKPHSETGGTYALGGTTDPSLNVTYNYSIYFARVFGDNGIRNLEGKTAKESLDWLRTGLDKLLRDADADYWKATEGNARKALVSLYMIAEQAVDEGKGDAVWRVC